MSFNNSCLVLLSWLVVIGSFNYMVISLIVQCISFSMAHSIAFTE